MDERDYKAMNNQENNNDFISDVSESCIEFAIWLQDNYSQNKKQGGKEMLQKGYMREDFTNNSFPISELWQIFNSK